MASTAKQDIKVSMFVKPDLSRFPRITHGKVWFHLDDNIVKTMKPLERALARAQNAVRFAWFSTGNAELMHCNESEEARLRAGFFRAALAEFVSIEDVLKLDLAALGNSALPLRLNETPNPVLHLFRELRNHEIHLKQSPFSRTEIDILWGNIDQHKEVIPLCISIWTLDGISVESFLELNNVKRNYTEEEVCKLVGWLNQSQVAWGIQQLFLIAVEGYCQEMIHRYLQDGP